MSEIVLEGVSKHYGAVRAAGAGTLMAVAPLLVEFLLFQRQFMQSFMQAGIK